MTRAGPGSPSRRPGRHRLHTTHRRWVHDDALGWLHLEETTRMDPDQDDLTADDHLVEQTEKGDDGADTEFGATSQDPGWVPDSAIDEFGGSR